MFLSGFIKAQISNNDYIWAQTVSVLGSKAWKERLAAIEVGSFINVGFFQPKPEMWLLNSLSNLFFIAWLWIGLIDLNTIVFIETLGKSFQIWSF